MKRKDLLGEIRQGGGFRSENIVEKLIQAVLKFEKKDSSEVDTDNLKQSIKIFVSKCEKKFQNCSRSYDKLFKQENEWLDKDIEVKIHHAGPSGGRPVKSWEELGARSKQYKVAALSDNPAELLNRAAFKAQKKENYSGDIVSLKRKSLPEASDVVKMQPVVDALSLKIQCDLSDDQYQLIRNSSLMQNADIYPTLHELLTEKKKCVPNDININETEAKCSLQSITYHTLERIVDLPESKTMINNLGSHESHGKMYFKVGFDGASSQSIYKQKYMETDLNQARANEETLFQTAIVPLK